MGSFSEFQPTRGKIFIETVDSFMLVGVGMAQDGIFILRLASCVLKMHRNCESNLSKSLMKLLTLFFFFVCEFTFDFRLII